MISVIKTYKKKNIYNSLAGKPTAKLMFDIYGGVPPNSYKII